MGIKSINRKKWDVPVKRNFARIAVAMIPLLFFVFSCDRVESTQQKKQGFDSTLAAKLGADDYGMKQYVLAYLKKGPKRDQDSATAAKLQTAHMANIGRMAQAGQLVLPGPFMDDTDVRGIYIFNTGSVDSAAKWTKTDPAIVAGRLVMELHPWYGSAALMQVNELHNNVQKKGF